MAQHGEPVRCYTRQGSKRDSKLGTLLRERGARGDKDGEAGVFRTINSAIVA